MKKLVVTLILAIATAGLAGAALAQRGGGSHGGGSAGGQAGSGWHGSGSQSGSWHGGGSQSGNWHGGNFGRGWHGGGYYGRGWYGGWWGPRVGVYFGAPGFWGAWADPWYWGYPYAYAYPYSWAPAAAYAAPDAATSWVEPTPPTAEQAPMSTPTYWYYCPDPAGYYPYVRNCAQPWLPVDPKSVPAPN